MGRQMACLRGAALASVLALACGCESQSTTRPLSARDQQDRALADPMGYKPDFSNDRVTSGGIGDFDKKGFDRDLKSVLDP